MDFQQDSAGVLRFGPWRNRSELVHGFTTRTTGNFKKLRSLGFLSSVLNLDGMRLSMLTQVHSNHLIVEKDAQIAEHSEADGLLTNVSGRVLGIRTADCFAILLTDPNASCVAAVHAGWRGTIERIAFRAVEKMVCELEACPERIEAIVGPGIESCCFEVDKDTASQFDGQFVREGTKTCVDLGEANRVQLLDAGLPEGNICSVGRCSYCEKETFFSYRREGKSAGRMLAFIGLRPGLSLPISPGRP